MFCGQHEQRLQQKKIGRRRKQDILFKDSLIFI